MSDTTGPAPDDPMLGYKPGAIEGVPDSIFECFPSSGALHGYLWWATQTTDAPVWFHIGSILTAAACEVARRGWIIDPEQEIRPRLWIAMVAAPGVGKSTAINTARDFYADACTRAKLADPYITADGSIQGLFEAIAQKKDPDTGVTAAILTREEFSTLLSGKRRDDLGTALCEWADGRYHERHTRAMQKAAAAGAPGAGGHASIANPAVSATFVTTQQALLDVATLAHMHGGLFSRFDWIIGHGKDVTPKMHRARRADERAVALELWADWAGWFCSESATNTAKVGKIDPEVYTYLRSTLFVDYKRALDSEDPLTAHYKRAITHAYIIAGIYAVSQARAIIQPIDIHRAVNLLNACLENINRFAPEVAVTPIMRASNRAFEFIRRGGAKGVTRSALYRFLQVSKRDLEGIIDTLKDEGSITTAVAVRSGKPGRPATRYKVVGDRRYAGEEDEVRAFEPRSSDEEDDGNVVPLFEVDEANDSE